MNYPASVIEKKDTETDLTLHWTSKDNLLQWEKVLYYLVISLSCAYAIMHLWLYLKLRLAPSPFNMFFLIPCYFSIARLSELWPYTAGNFAYFRNGQLLYRIGNSSLKLDQGTIVFSRLRSVFVHPKSIILKTSEKTFSFSTSAIPAKLKSKFKKKLFLEIKKYDYIVVQKVATRQTPV